MVIIAPPATVVKTINSNCGGSRARTRSVPRMARFHSTGPRRTTTSTSSGSRSEPTFAARTSPRCRPSWPRFCPERPARRPHPVASPPGGTRWGERRARDERRRRLQTAVDQAASKGRRVRTTDRGVLARLDCREAKTASARTRRPPLCSGRDSPTLLSTTPTTITTCPILTASRRRTLSRHTPPERAECRLLRRERKVRAALPFL